MQHDTDVLIVGAGPTGLMMACQLTRFNIPFQIIDKQADRTRESRAFGIQARSMEIFQNLGIADEFLRRAQAGARAEIYIKGKMRIRFDIEKLDIQGTPFPTIYFLPQADTEEILLDYLQKKNITVQRNKELQIFSQNDQGITATIKDLTTGINKQVTSKYIVGCDGAHSGVRHLLGINFEGASYKQEFMLADCEIDWPYPKDDGVFRVFVDKPGVFGVIPLPKRLDRIIAARVYNKADPLTFPTPEELKELGESITHDEINIHDVAWASRFYLHHRAVKDYQVGRAFIAGDAAHIHTPAGGQGMNTGLQDATNLAWKLALVLQYGAQEKLLQTYQSERHMIGQILVKTTDRLFGLLASQNIFVRWFRFTIMPYIMEYINKHPEYKQKMFLFISELNIHYHASEFAYQVVEGADKKFLSTLGIVYRAPDAPYQNSTLFAKFAEFPCHILIFISGETLTPLQEQQLEDIEKLNNKLIRTLTIKHNSDTQIIFDRYGVSDSALYFIRPDGYIGFRSYGLHIEALLNYINKLLTH